MVTARAFSTPRWDAAPDLTVLRRGLLHYTDNTTILGSRRARYCRPLHRSRRVLRFCHAARDFTRFSASSTHAPRTRLPSRLGSFSCGSHLSFRTALHRRSAASHQFVRTCYRAVYHLWFHSHAVRRFTLCGFATTPFYHSATARAYSRRFFFNGYSAVVLRGSTSTGSSRHCAWFAVFLFVVLPAAPAQRSFCAPPAHHLRMRLPLPALGRLPAPRYRAVDAFAGQDTLPGRTVLPVPRSTSLRRSGLVCCTCRILYHIPPLYGCGSSRWTHARSLSLFSLSPHSLPLLPRIRRFPPLLVHLPHWFAAVGSLSPLSTYLFGLDSRA